MSKYDDLRKELEAEATAVAQAIVAEEREQRRLVEAECALLRKKLSIAERMCADEKAARAKFEETFTGMEARIKAAFPEYVPPTIPDHGTKIDAMCGSLLAEIAKLSAEVQKKPVVTQPVKVSPPTYEIAVTERFPDGRAKVFAAKPKGLNS
jgi:hypothetical protein